MAIATATGGKLVKLTLPPLHSGQRPVVFDLHRIVVASMGTKWGKTFSMAEWLIMQAWNRYQSLNWWCGPTYRQSKIAWELIGRMLPKSRYRPLKADLMYELLRADGSVHSRMEFRSADNPESLRGEGVHAAVVDEAAYWGHSSFVSVWTTLTRTRGLLRIISTPKGRNWFYEEHAKGWYPEMREKFPEYSSYQLPTWMNPYVPKESIEEARRNLPADVFKQEYCHLPDTLVVLAEGGTRPVRDLKPGDMLVTYAGALQPCEVTACRRTGTKFVIGVELETGQTFEASVGHSVKSSAGKVALEDACDICLVPGRAVIQERQAVLARLVGYNIGDGTISRRKTGGHQTAYYSSVASDLEAIAADFLLLGFNKPNVRQKKSNPNMLVLNAKPHYQLQLGNGAAQLLIESGCPVGKKVALDFDVPAWIVNGSDDVKAEFLAALFGAEGSTPRQSGRMIRGPEMSMWKRSTQHGHQFFEQLSQLLSDLGIRSSVQCRVRPQSAKAYGNGYAEHERKLVIGGDRDNLVRFFQRVGYRYCEIKDRKGLESAMYLLAYESYANGKNTSRADHKFQSSEQWLCERRTSDGIAARVIRQYFVGHRDVCNITVDSADHSYVLASGVNNYNCAEFLDESAGVFKNVRNCQTAEWRDAPEKGGVYVVGIDWAKMADFTVFTVMERSTKSVCYMERHNQLDWNFNVKKAIDLAKKWNNAHIIMDATGVGDVPLDSVRSVYPHCEGYQISNNAPKVALIQKLQFALENNQIQLPHPKKHALAATLEHELSVYEYEMSTTGKFLFSAPEGMHDDCVISLALANWVAQQEPFVYRGRLVRGV